MFGPMLYLLQRCSRCIYLLPTVWTWRSPRAYHELVSVEFVSLMDYRVAVLFLHICLFTKGFKGIRLALQGVAVYA